MMPHSGTVGGGGRCKCLLCIYWCIWCCFTLLAAPVGASAFSGTAAASDVDSTAGSSASSSLKKQSHADDSVERKTGYLPENVESVWNGHVKLFGKSSYPQAQTPFIATGLGANNDGLFELRVNNKTFWSDSVYTTVHWESAVAGGGTREDGAALKKLYPALYPDGLSNAPDDDRRFFDLTHVVYEDDGTVAYHRLDRAMLVATRGWGEVRAGRQAITWGHGFTFNPVDLFNPFAPTDLERDYKTGDDMLSVYFPYGGTDVELLYVPRRDPATEHSEFSQHSAAAKVSWYLDELGVDAMAARHYEDYVAGFGLVGYAGNAAWRMDVTATFLEQESRGRSVYISAVANMDYSWVWLDKNWYGYAEVYYNGLSDGDYVDHFSDPAISERLSRGELYALGAWYASTHVSVELHPLVNAGLTTIVNLHDPSGVLLPEVTYDISSNIQLTVSAATYWGADNTEYGGYTIPKTPFTQRPSDSVSVWMTYYF